MIYFLGYADSGAVDISFIKGKNNIFPSNKKAPTRICAFI
jgi:hypothetical protein